MKKFLILLFLIFFQVFFINISNAATWQTYFNQGIKHFNQKNYKEAITDFSNSINLNPNNIHSYINKAHAEYNIKDYSNAIIDYSNAIQINPKDEKLYIYRGNAKRYSGHYWGAIDDYNYSIKIKSNEEAISNIKEIKSDFQNPFFISTNYKYILEDLGYAQFWTLLACIIILIFVHPTRNNHAFKEYDQDDIYHRFKFWQININTPVPKPEDFHLDRSRIDFLERIYQESNKPFWNFDDDSSSQHIAMWSFILSFFFCGFMNKIISMYFDDISKDWSWIIIIGIPAIIIYFTFKKIPIFFRTNPEVTPHERQTYLLYKGALELYHKEMAPIKAAEEEKQRKIREEEERKLKQQRSYWQKYWAEKQQNGFEFENAVGELYKKLGYKVTVTQGTGDGGVDLILRKSGVITIVQCKAHTHQVGPEPVRALWGVREDFNATEAIFIAYSGVTSGAIDFAKGKKLQLLNVENLISLSMQVYADKPTTKSTKKQINETKIQSTTNASSIEKNEDSLKTKINNIENNTNRDDFINDLIMSNTESREQITKLYSDGIISKEEFITRMRDDKKQQLTSLYVFGTITKDEYIKKMGEI